MRKYTREYATNNSKGKSGSCVVLKDPLRLRPVADIADDAAARRRSEPDRPGLGHDASSRAELRWDLPRLPQAREVRPPPLRRAAGAATLRSRLAAATVGALGAAPSARARLPARQRWQ
jgi:hypothetical protein